MQASAIFTCIVLTVKALTDIFYTLVLFQRQATEVTYVTISIYLVLFVVELSPITGLVWLVTYPTGSNGKVPAVMCLLSILFGQFVLVSCSFAVVSVHANVEIDNGTLANFSRY